MNEYMIIRARTPEHAEKLMNQVCEEGWQVVCMTKWIGFFRACLLITFVRPKIKEDNK